MWKNPRLILPAILVAISVAALAAAALLMTSRDAPKQALVGGPFQLVAHDGRTVTDKDFAGKPFLVFFGYTHCPDVCPTTLFQASEALRALGPDARISALFITVDPERDTQASLKDYISNFDPRVVALTGNRPAIEAAARAYRAYAKKVPGKNDDYTYDHTAMVYLMDKKGVFAGSLNLEQPPEAAAAQLKKYL